MDLLIWQPFSKDRLSEKPECPTFYRIQWRMGFTVVTGEFWEYSLSYIPDRMVIANCGILVLM